MIRFKCVFFPYRMLQLGTCAKANGALTLEFCAASKAKKELAFVRADFESMQHVLSMRGHDPRTIQADLNSHRFINLLDAELWFKPERCIRGTDESADEWIIDSK